MITLMTKLHYTDCFICKNMTSVLYENFPDYICLTCLVKKNGGFPAGIDSLHPCKLCCVPYVKWYRRSTYLGEDYDRRDCGKHDDFSNMFLD